MTFTTRARFDEEDFAVRREAGFNGSFFPFLSTTLVYALRGAAELGYEQREASSAAPPW